MRLALLVVYDNFCVIHVCLHREQKRKVPMASNTEFCEAFSLFRCKSWNFFYSFPPWAIHLSLIWLILQFLSSRWRWSHLTVLQWPCLATPTTPLLWEVIDLTIIIFALQSYSGVDSLKLFWYICLCSKN